MSSIHPSTADVAVLHPRFEPPPAEAREAKAYRAKREGMIRLLGGVVLANRSVRRASEGAMVEISDLGYMILASCPTLRQLSEV